MTIIINLAITVSVSPVAVIGLLTAILTFIPKFFDLIKYLRPPKSKKKMKKQKR